MFIQNGSKSDDICHCCHIVHGFHPTENLWGQQTSYRQGKNQLRYCCRSKSRVLCAKTQSCTFKINELFTLFQGLSEQEHFIDGEHNPKYDHEAFLGEEAKQFDDLTPEESRRRLGYVHKTDKVE